MLCLLSIVGEDHCSHRLAANRVTSHHALCMIRQPTLAAALRSGHSVVPTGLELGVITMLRAGALGLAVLEVVRTE